MRTPALTAVFLVFLLFALANAAFADDLLISKLVIDDSLPDPNIKVTWSAFQGGLSLNGDPRFNDSNKTVDESLNVGFAGRWIDGGKAETVHKRVYFTEGNTNEISDIFEYSIFSDGQFGNLGGSFQSDVTGSLGTLPLVLQTDDLVVKDESYSFTAVALSVSVISDAEAPESSLLPFIGFGLVVLASRKFAVRMSC